MSNYTKIVDYAAKDALNTGDPVKLVKGTEIGAEYDAISVAIATKANTASPAFTGVSSFAVGAVGAPSIYMTGYATTGWYNIGANNWGFAVSGAKVLDIASTGLSVTGTLNATGAINKTNTAATNSTILSGTTTTTAGQSITMTNTGGTAFIGLEDSTGAYQGGTAYDFLLGQTAGRGISLFISGTGTIARATSTGLAVTGALSSTGILSALNTGATTTTAILTTGVSDPSFRLEAVNGAAGGGAGAEQAKFGVTYAGAFDTGLQFLRGSGTQNGTLNLMAGAAVVASASSVGLAITGDVSVSTKTPASASAAGVAGTITWDASFLYVCTATDTWKRVAIATW